MDYAETQIPLSQEDISKLRSMFRRSFVIAAIVIFLFLLLFGWIVFFMLDEGEEILHITFFILLPLMIVIFIAGYKVPGRQVKKDISEGIKTRIAGVVTKKKETEEKRSAGGGRSSTLKKHFLCFGENEIEVSQKNYSSVRVGNNLIIERVPNSKYDLKFEVTAK